MRGRREKDSTALVLERELCNQRLVVRSSSSRACCLSLSVFLVERALAFAFISNPISIRACMGRMDEQVPLLSHLMYKK